MRKDILWLAALASSLVTGLAIAGEVAVQGPTVARALARREANVIQVNTRPTLLLWAQGVADPADLDQYREAGLNTVCITITEPSDEQLERASTLASAAESRGLLVVVELAPAALRDEEGVALFIDASLESYANAVRGFVNAVVGRMANHPRLVAWSVAAVPPGEVSWGDEGFRLHLQGPGWYDSLEAVNRSWGSGLESWDDVTTAGVREIDSTYPAGLGRASIDFSYYRQEVYADALSLWAKALRAADPGRLVFASALPDYRSIVSVKPDFDGLVLNTYPSRAEADWDTHNVHAVDIARRGNQFAAIQTLEIGWGTTERQVANWVNLALLHGAAGVAFSNWSVLREWPWFQEAMRQTAEALRSDLPFPQQPLARAAVLYQPVAGGAMRDGQGLYGYLDGVTPQEPTALFTAARNGSRFGQLDVLTLSSIGEVDLNTYRTIIAPMALYLPEAAQLALQNFVLRGGALVLDAGVGMYQAGGTIMSVPPVIREMLGLRYADLSAPDPWREQGLQGDLGGPGEPGAPGEPGQLGEPGVAIPVAPAKRGLITNPELQQFADILQEFVGRTDVTKYLGTSFTEGDGPRPRVRELGQGFAVYIPAFIYQEWDPWDPKFQDLHAQVLSRNADVEIIEPAGLWPQTPVAVYRDWLIGVASGSGSSVVVDGYDAQNQMYLIPGGAMRLANPEEDNRIELLFPGAPLALVNPVPIYVRPQAEGAIVTAAVSRYDGGGIELLIHGTGAQVTRGQEGLQISGGATTPVEVEIRSGMYPVARGSMHRVLIQDSRWARTQSDQIGMPNPDRGSLIIQAPVRWSRITITPAPE